MCMVAWVAQIFFTTDTRLELTVSAVQFVHCSGPNSWISCNVINLSGGQVRHIHRSELMFIVYVVLVFVSKYVQFCTICSLHYSMV